MTLLPAGSALPRMSAELLWFEVAEHGVPACAVNLPGGEDVAFAHRDAVHAMRAADWWRFQDFLRSAD